MITVKMAQIQPLKLPASMRVSDVAKTIHELYEEYDADDPWDSSLYRSGPVYEDKPTFYHTQQEGAKFYEQVQNAPIDKHPGPSGPGIFLDLEDIKALNFISKLAGYKNSDDAFNQVGDVALIIEAALPKLKTYGLPWLIIEGETGMGVTGVPIEVVKL